MARRAPDEVIRAALFPLSANARKILKALLIEFATSGTVRRTHDLASLAEELQLGFSTSQLRFLRRLTELYVPVRYGEDDIDLGELSPKEWLQQTEELWTWLSQRLT